MVFKFKTKGKGVAAVRHPDYKAAELELYRDTISLSAKEYIEKYLQKYTLRERAADFELRKLLTSLPAYAKAALNEVKNSIYDRIPDVVRTNCPKSYLDAVTGENGGVDLSGSTMTSFIGNEAILELIGMQRVGFFVDIPYLEGAISKLETSSVHPYTYIYEAEDILTWKYDANHQLVNVLLRHCFDAEEKHGLVSGIDHDYYLFSFNEAGLVERRTFSHEGEETEFILTELTEIPFYIAKLPSSLLEDVARHQVTLLNLNSSDIHFAHSANFPLYVEQYDPASEAMNNIPTNSLVETAKRDEDYEGETSKKVSVGSTTGRRYPKGFDAPAYIHPSPAPLKASMDKQNSLIQEIRQLMHLSLANMREDQRSADSRRLDNHGLESGLASIGVELEKAERKIQDFWCMYTGETPGSINYPRSYELKSDAERIAEAKDLLEIQKTNPSPTFQREVSRQIANNLLGSRVTITVMETITKEINEAPIAYVDPATLHADIEAGLATTDTVSQIRGYASGEAEKAMKQRAERAAMIVAAQSVVGSNPAARGVEDLATGEEPNEKDTQDSSLSADNKKAVRS